MVKSICFISRYAHHVLMNETETKIGGAEFQQTVIGRALRNRGWHVVFITEKFANGEPLVVDGITIMGGLDYRAGSRITRRFLRLPFQLWKYMGMSNAHVFYQRNPGLLSSFIGIYSRLRNKRFVLAGASDANFDKNNELNVNSPIDKLDIKYGIQLADLIILQNKRQKFLLKKSYGKDGSTFYNLYDPPRNFRPVQSVSISDRKPRIIWVGRMSREKRPELCLDLARILTEFEIVVVGAREPSAKRQPIVDVTEASRSLPNLTYLGHLPLEDVEKQFDYAQALINTSSVEGFPNTFLQAWSRGMPVFSFIDPDNVITTNSLGSQVNSVDEMAAAIRERLYDTNLFMRQAENIRKYFTCHFSVSQQIQKLENLLLYGQSLNIS